MIYASKGNRYLSYSTPLIDYIRKNNLYINENLIYTKKYSNGTFSITNPTNKYKNCELINGYPHFILPIDIILDEIYFFINDGSMYSNNIFVRYGDSHPHKSVPKLSQMRNLILDNTLVSMIGQNARNFFALGDISIKSLNQFSKKYNLNVSGEQLFIDVVNDNLDEIIKYDLNQYNLHAIDRLKEFLNTMKLNESDFIIESKLYKNQELYHRFKDNPKYKDELKKNGELKYTLQEMMFIYSFLTNESDVLISIIGANQSDHIKKVNQLVNTEKPKLDFRFLSYEMCRNGDDNNYENWSLQIQDFIRMNKFIQDGNEMDYRDFLKALIIVNSNDVIVDFCNLNKYVNHIKEFNHLVDAISKHDSISIEINDINDLLCKMSLVGYNLNRAIEMGNQNMFYKYLLGIANEYEQNREKYKGLSGLYYNFMVEAMKRLNYPIDDSCKRRVLK